MLPREHRWTAQAHSADESGHREFDSAMRDLAGLLGL
jgi:hypothetical protein